MFPQWPQEPVVPFQCRSSVSTEEHVGVLRRSSTLEDFLHIGSGRNCSAQKTQPVDSCAGCLREDHGDSTTGEFPNKGL